MILQQTLTKSSIRGHYIRNISALNPTDFFSCTNLVTSVPSQQRDVHNSSHLRNKRFQESPSSYSIVRSYHTSPVVAKSPATIILSLSAIAATAKAGQYMVRAYEQWKLSQPEKPPVSPEQEASTQEDNIKTDKSKGADEDGKRENIFQSLFNIGVGSKFYEGGFEEKMTRREAALILGVRETSTTKRIKENHRKLLVLNHPDTGGSTYLAGKINEAKELLMKGRREQ